MRFEKRFFDLTVIGKLFLNVLFIFKDVLSYLRESRGEEQREREF